MLRVLVLTLLAGSAVAQTTEQSLRYGESINGFPNWSERVIHEWMNRARVDPQAALAACAAAACPDKSCYTAMPPLAWSEPLNRAARFHAAELDKQHYGGHDSQCTVVANIDALFPTGCDGSASCACVGGAASCATAGCTTWAQRVALFGATAGGEVWAGWSDPDSVFRAWLLEAGGDSGCGFSPQNGHRWLI